MEVILDKDLEQWSGNHNLFDRLRDTIFEEFNLESKKFELYDPIDDFYTDDINDLYSCYMAHDKEYDFEWDLTVEQMGIIISKYGLPSLQNIFKMYQVQKYHSHRHRKGSL